MEEVPLKAGELDSGSGGNGGWTCVSERENSQVNTEAATGDGLEDRTMHVCKLTGSVGIFRVVVMVGIALGLLPS